MAAFPSRDRDAFMAHWARIMSNETGILNTILADDTVAGNVVYWEAAGEPNIGYWLGKTHWGKGSASAALAQFLTRIGRDQFTRMWQSTISLRYVSYKN